MLQMRARGFRLHDSFPDVLGGMYLREELMGRPSSMRLWSLPSASCAPFTEPYLDAAGREAHATLSNAAVARRPASAAAVR